MPSFLPHAVIPCLVALAFFPMSRRRIVALVPFAWAPDLDYLVPGLHRAVTTNVWIPLAFLVAVVLLWRRRDPDAGFWSFAVRPGTPANLTLISYYWGSHVFLDVFAGGAVLFWPLLDINFFWFYQIVLDTGTNTFTDELEVGTEAGAPTVTPTYEWFSAEHNAILWFLVACALAGAAAWAWRRWRAGPHGKTVVPAVQKPEKR